MVRFAIQLNPERSRIQKLQNGGSMTGFPAGNSTVGSGHWKEAISLLRAAIQEDMKNLR